jgi:hypothetical protein
MDELATSWLIARHARRRAGVRMVCPTRHAGCICLRAAPPAWYAAAPFSVRADQGHEESGIAGLEGTCRRKLCGEVAEVLVRCIDGGVAVVVREHAGPWQSLTAFVDAAVSGDAEGVLAAIRDATVRLLQKQAKCARFNVQDAA